MCRLSPPTSSSPTTATATSSTSTSTATATAAASQLLEQSKKFFSSPRSFPKLPVWLIFCMLPFLPIQSMFLNQGYTKWCHWMSVAYFLTRNRSLGNFICLQSLLINVGWYCTLSTDYWVDGRMGDILFRNMPLSIAQYIVSTEDNISGQNVALITNTPEARQYIVLSVALDILFHPILCATFWYISKQEVRKILSWRNVAATVAMSRFWSILHNWYHYYGVLSNNGNDDINIFYYYGTHVYNVHAVSNHLWTAAYVGETVTLCLIVLYKLLLEEKDATITTTTAQHKSKRSEWWS